MITNLQEGERIFRTTFKSRNKSFQLTLLRVVRTFYLITLFHCIVRIHGKSQFSS